MLTLIYVIISCLSTSKCWLFLLDCIMIESSAHMRLKRSSVNVGSRRDAKQFLLKIPYCLYLLMVDFIVSTCHSPTFHIQLSMTRQHLLNKIIPPGKIYQPVAIKRTRLDLPPQRDDSRDRETLCPPDLMFAGIFTQQSHFCCLYSAARAEKQGERWLIWQHGRSSCILCAASLAKRAFLGLIRGWGTATLPLCPSLRGFQ